MPHSLKCPTRRASCQGPVPHAHAVGQNLLVTSDVHRLHRAFDEAELRADTHTLQALLADDFRSIGDQGYVLDKTQWIGKFAEFVYTSLESSDVEVHCYDHAAIVRCVQRSRSSLAGPGDGVNRSRQPDLGRAARGLATCGHSVQHSR